MLIINLIIKGEFTSLKECGVLLSKMGELFIQDIILKSLHHRHNHEKDKSDIIIEKEDVAISLANTEEYDFLVSNVVPEYEDYINRDSRFYMTCTVIEKKGHYLITKDKKEILHLNIKENENHKIYTFFPNEEDVQNGIFNFIVKSDYDTEQSQAVFHLNGYFKLGDIIIQSIHGHVERKSTGSILKFKFNSSTKNEDGIVVFEGKGNAILGKDSTNTLVTVKFLMGDSNCYLVNEYVCNTLYPYNEDIVNTVS